jgi:hypothetical protein
VVSELVELPVSFPSQGAKPLSFPLTGYSYEKELNMPFLSTIEELAEERGQVKGAKETCQNNIIKILSKRFDHVTELMSNSITKIDDMLILENLLLSSISVPSLEEFQKLIDAELQQNQ